MATSNQRNKLMQEKLFSPELKELVTLIAANASIALTKEEERHESLDRLDGLVERYIQSRKAN